jgi:VWFA-related protein
MLRTCLAILVVAYCLGPRVSRCACPADDGQATVPPAQLVRLNIVALDNNNHSVRDLTADDFQVFDRGKRQKLAVFRRNEKKADESGTLGPNTYSNRSTAAPPHTVVILFDMLNDHMASRGYAEHEIVQSLERLPSGDNVFLYLLTMTGRLYPVRPLPGPEGPPAAASAGWARQVGPILDRAIRDVFSVRPPEMVWDVDYRVRTTYGALDQMSSALAGIPGRKSIVWITHGIPIEIGPRRTGTDDWIDYSGYLRQLSSRFDESNVAIYPVVLSPPGMSDSMSATNNTPGPSGNSNMGASLGEPARGIESLDTLQQFADLTGGRTYMQDVKGAISEAVDEARVGYLIEFDPYPQKWDGKYHKIRVTCSRPKVRIQTKKGYYAFPPQALNADQQLMSLRAAASSPFDTAEIGLRVSVLPSPAGPKARRFQIRFTGEDLFWLRQDNEEHADVALMFVEFGPEGPQSATKPVPLTLRRPGNSRDQDVTIDQDVPLPEAVPKIRIVVLDRDSSSAGSITVPVAMAANTAH